MLDWSLSRRQIRPSLWVSTVVDEDLFVTNTGRSRAYEVIVRYVPVHLRVTPSPAADSDLTEPDYHDLTRMMKEQPFGYSLEFPLGADEQVRLDFQNELIEPFVQALAKLPQFAYITESIGPSHVTMFLKFDLECIWFEAGHERESSTWRRGLRTAFRVACGYDKPNREWRTGTYHVDAGWISGPALRRQ